MNIFKMTSFLCALLISGAMSSVIAMKSDSTLPHGNCYWIEPGRFLAGKYPLVGKKKDRREQTRKFLDAGITYFIDLTEKRELKTKGGKRYPYAEELKKAAQKRGMKLRHKRMPIKDHKVTTKAHMIQIVAMIYKALAKGHNVYIHCAAGKGRTGTAVGCYLRTKGLTAQQAFDLIAKWRNNRKRSRKPSPEKSIQRKFVKRFNVK